MLLLIWAIEFWLANTRHLDIIIIVYNLPTNQPTKQQINKQITVDIRQIVKVVPNVSSCLIVEKEEKEKQV